MTIAVQQQGQKKSSERTREPLRGAFVKRAEKIIQVQDRNPENVSERSEQAFACVVMRLGDEYSSGI